ncbi:MAG: adenylyl-sulfate kinase [Comamonadaceae bacterium SCN 68-20]|jgi:adenylyl-sulfate kinase|nr:adenylyl-sulfate kinase [Comamonadaceae bacterium]ODU60563.1 MAG: adenylyl-sulfate kinase [Comamonadaceae bacterium SCN 68-20]OJX30111.1 MAG: adenylyl-sulfate kinase [Burkholderiales bacterium 68-20]
MKPLIQAVPHQLTRADRRNHHGHDGAVLWLTGLSAAGKSTLAMAVEQQLTVRGYSCYVLDGDNVRHGLNADLGFSPEDRTENIRRVGEVAALFADAGLVCLCAFISPYQADRLKARQACRQAFHEVHVAADIATCATRDPKGLYQKADAGMLSHMTGLSAPYEPPDHCELRIDTHRESVQQSTEKLLRYITHAVPLAHPLRTP